MNRIDLANVAALLTAIGAMLLSVRGGERIDSKSHSAGSGYHRMASASLVGDALLAELCEPDRVVAVSTALTGPNAYKLGDKPRIELGDIERIVSLKPDFVLASTMGGAVEKVERLREHGIKVIDLGDADGVASLLRSARQFGNLIGEPERAERFATAFERRMSNVDASLPANAHRFSSIYLAQFSGQLFGGTVGSSYHDVLTAAGLVDVAATKYHGWPQLSAEQVIELDPEIIVTKRGMATEVKKLPGFSALRACRDAHGIVELDDALLEDPGPLMLDAAEALFAAVYGSR